MDRRAFVVAGALAAAASSLEWLRGHDLSGIALADVPAARPGDPGIFGAIVRAGLPFEDPRLAVISAAQVTARANKLFSVDKDPDVRQNLAMFDDLHLFLTPPPPLTAIELALYPVEDKEKNLTSPVATRAAIDAKSFETLSSRSGAPAAFTQLPVAQQRAYLMLWAHSALGVRRRFYRSIKTLVMAATYSMDDVWSMIGYAGPLLHLRTS